MGTVMTERQAIESTVNPAQQFYAPYPGYSERSMQLFDEALKALQEETRARKAMLEARKGDITKLGHLAAFLCARGWRALPHVTSHASGAVELDVWVNVQGYKWHADLLEDLARATIVVSRAEYLDHGDTYGYVLTLDNTTQLKLRISMSIAQARAAV